MLDFFVYCFLKILLHGESPCAEGRLVYVAFIML